MSDNPALRTALSLAADHYNRYPGELVTLFARFTAPSQPGASLQLVMPRVMQVETYRMPAGVPPSLPGAIEHGEEVIVHIPLDGYFTPGTTYDLEFGVHLKTFYANQYLQVEAQLTRADEEILASESLRLTVFGSGKYLQYLPEIYTNDDFASRFLMLIESFWKPINQQIDQVDHYFDPRLTPPVFVPWLASWIGVPVDASLPLERVRELLRNALMFFQCRGTPLAMKKYLEIYTTGEAHIIERRAHNLTLGGAAVLGMDVALGRENQPNTVDIRLSVPASELERTHFSPETYQKKIIELVRALVPAQVLFDVTCEFVAQQS